MTQPDYFEVNLSRLLTAAYDEPSTLSPAARVHILEQLVIEVEQIPRRRRASVRRALGLAALAAIAVMLVAGAYLLFPGGMVELGTLQVEAGSVEVEQTRNTFLWFQETTTANLDIGQRTVLAAGDRIQAGSEASAVLAFFEGNLTEIGPGVDLSIEQLERDPEDGSVWITLRLWFGQLSSIRPPTDRPAYFEIKTPAISASVQGTAFTVDAIADDHTYVATDEGRVSVRMGEQAAFVRAGEEVDAILGRPLMVRSQTPSTPVLDLLSEIVYTATINVGGQVVPSPKTAPAVQVEVYVDDVLETILVPDAEGRFAITFTAPEPGAYRFFAVAISERGAASPPADAVFTTYEYPEAIAPTFQQAQVVAGDIRAAGPGVYATRQSSVILTGQGTPGDRVTLYVEGTETAAVTVETSGRFTFEFNFPEEGSYQFTAVAENAWGKLSEEVPLATVIYDMTAPFLAIDSGPQPEVTVDSVTFVGRTEPGATLTVNGEVVPVDEDGGFSFTVDLQPGANPIRIVVSDAAGNMIRSTSTIIRK